MEGGGWREKGKGSAVGGPGACACDASAIATPQRKHTMEHLECKRHAAACDGGVVSPLEMIVT